MEPSETGEMSDLKLSHTREAVRGRLLERHQHSYLRDFIYGAIDGTVTTFAVVSGVAGANLPPGIVIIMGMANLLGDGFSMAVSNFLGTRAEQELRTLARHIEECHIQKVPEGEREEIRQIFAAKGFKGRALENAVKIITSDQEQWVNTMLREELGLTVEGSSPWKAAALTFVAFVLIGLLPLAAFLVHFLLPALDFNPFLISALLTGIAFFTVGAFKSRFVGEKWYSAGIETLLAGSGAAVLAYWIGVFLGKMIIL